MTLNDIEAKVLRWLSEQGKDWYFPFAPIVRETGLDVKTVRRACRALKRKGLAEFSSGLWSEYDGTPAGSGYRATSRGVEISDAREKALAELGAALEIEARDAI